MIPCLAKLLFWILVFVCVVHGQKTITSGKAEQNLNQQVTRDENDEFRYVIIADATEIQRSVNDNKYYRNLIVLIDESGFNESNLKTLFNLLSKRFNDRPGLYVNVITSLEAIPTPEEFDKMDLFGLRPNYREFKNAFFSRAPRGNVIRYEVPGKLPVRELFLVDDSK